MSQYSRWPEPFGGGGGGGGTVTSVGIAAPGGLLNVASSPVTTSGTIILSLATQAANTALMGPIGGGPAAPTFRVLDISDMPTGLVTNVSASSPLFSSGGATPNLTIQNATALQTGALTASDWSTFNSKQAALGYTPVNKAGDTMLGILSMGGFELTSVLDPTAAQSAATKNYVDTATTKGNLTEAVSSVLTVTGGTNSVFGSGTSIQVKQVTTVQDGYLSAADFSVFTANLSSANIDGGAPNSVYGGISVINGGTP